jgi:hypothetical protein
MIRKYIVRPALETYLCINDAYIGLNKKAKAVVVVSLAMTSFLLYNAFETKYKAVQQMRNLLETNIKLEGILLNQQKLQEMPIIPPDALDKSNQEKNTLI